MKLKTVALALASACMLSAASSLAAVVSYLDTYDQLDTKMGQDGLFFVLNAGSSAHGDPSVKRGWALYAWDTRGRDWKMLNKQDLMDLGSIDFNELLTKKMYSTDIGPFKTKVDTFGEQISQCVLGLAELKADDIIIKGQIETLDAKIGSYNGTITNLTDRVVTLENGQAVLVASVDELSAEVYSDMAKRDAAVSNNVIKIASDDATAKAGAAKEEAVALSAYAWDETSPIASKAISGITYNNVYVLKNKTQLTATSSATAITIQVPSKDGVIGVQRACSMYLNYTGTTKPTISIVGESGQTILTGESGSYDYSDIEAGKWLIYVLEVDKNVFWIQTERFNN